MLRGVVLLICAAGALSCGQVQAMKDASIADAGADITTSVDAVGPPLFAYGYEAEDFGDEPDFEGCVEEYSYGDNMCSGQIIASYGDTCLDGVTIQEVLEMDCEKMPLRTKSYDCRTYLKDPQATCVEVPDSCFPGNPKTGTKSAYCDAPFVVDAGGDGSGTDGGIILDASGG